MDTSMGSPHPEFYMIRLYGIEMSFDDGMSLPEIIRYTFNEFSLEGLDYINQYDGVYFSTFEQAFDWKSWAGNDSIGSLMIMEYELSEEDLVHIFFNRFCRKLPINVWYYWWNGEEKKLREMSKNLVGFT